MTKLIQALGNVFNFNGHQISNWKEFTLETDLSISRSVVGYRGSKSESQVRECLLSPVLTTVTQRMTLLPGVDCIHFDAYLLPEQTIRLHDGYSMHRLHRMPGIEKTSSDVHSGRGQTKIWYALFEAIIRIGIYRGRCTVFSLKYRTL